MTDSNPFWEYSLKLYSQPHVADSCLRLQNQYAVNINMLLFCCWLNAQQLPAKPDFIGRAQELIANWDEAAIKPLRAIRRGVKALASQSNPSFYQQFKALELEAEKIQQDQLYDSFLTYFDEYTKQPGSNLSVYLSQFESIPETEISLLLSASTGIQ